MFRKITLILLLFIFVMATGANCSCSGQKKPSATPINLVMWGVFDDESVYKPIIDQYRQLYPNVTITYVKKSYDEYEKETVDALAGNRGPDIWMIRNDWVYQHQDKLVPMTKGLLQKSTNDPRNDIVIYTDTFPDIAVKDNIINGKILGLPLSIDTLAVYYNKEHFTEVQRDLYAATKNDIAALFNYPPNNWEEFLKMSELLTKKDASGNIVRSGAAIGTALKTPYATDILVAMMLQNKTEMVSADKLTAMFNLPITKGTGELVYPGTEALKFYTSFSKPGNENYMWNDTMNEAVLAFMEGKTSMMINYAYIRNRLEQEAPNLRYAVGPLPQIAGATESVDYASYYTETVTNNSKNPEAAWQFINYMFNTGLGEYLAATRKPSPKRISVLSVPNTKERATLGGDPLMYQPMTAKYWYKGAYPNKIDNVFFEMINSVITQNEDFQRAIDKAATLTTELYKLTQEIIKAIPSSNPSISPTTTKK